MWLRRSLHLRDFLLRRDFFCARAFFFAALFDMPEDEEGKTACQVALEVGAGRSVLSDGGRASIRASPGAAGGASPALSGKDRSVSPKRQKRLSSTFRIPDDDLVAMYRHMRMCRQFDEIAFKLQRSGRMGTYPENRGQECPSLGAAYALTDKDWLVPCYRENAGLFWRGLPMEYVLLHWMGDERGNEIPEDVRVTPLAIPIGTQMLHAAGLAWSHKYRGEDSVACTFFGDGATSEGDFHEAMDKVSSPHLDRVHGSKACPLLQPVLPWATQERGQITRQAVTRHADISFGRW